MKRLLVFFFVLLTFTGFLSAYTYEVAIMAIFRNEADWLKEWIDYHKKIGVDHFYLYNHLSTDDYQEILAPYIKEGSVEVIEWTHVKFPESQLLATKDCITRQKKKVKWLALIDTDEFIVPKKVDNLKDFLAQYENYAGVLINWQLFGTSDIHSLSRDESLLTNLTWKFPTNYSSKWNSNSFCKSIVRPERIDEFTKDPNCGNHVFMPNNKRWKMVNSKKKPQKITCAMDAVVIDDIQLNHYWFRTLEWFYTRKLERQDGIGRKYPQDMVETILKEGHSEQDFAIQRLW